MARENSGEYRKKALQSQHSPHTETATERWPSGRRRSPAKGVYRKRYRGFESLLLRHPSLVRPGDIGNRAYLGFVDNVLLPVRPSVSGDAMATLRIYDLKRNVLALDLRDLLQLLAPRTLEASWTVSTVKSSKPGHEWFQATGDGGEQLEELAQDDARLSGFDLAALAEKTQQVIWGEFVGSRPMQSDKTWVTIRAVDSTFYEIDTDDETVLSKISSTYDDVRTGEAAITSWLVDRSGE